MNREERGLKNENIKQNLEANLPGAKTTDGLLEIARLGKISGEVNFRKKFDRKGNLILVRGKKKLGYDLTVKLHLKGRIYFWCNFEGLGEFEGSEVNVKFTEFTDDGNYEVIGLNGE